MSDAKVLSVAEKDVDPDVVTTEQVPPVKSDKSAENGDTPNINKVPEEINTAPKETIEEDSKKSDKEVAQAVDENGQNDEKQPASGVRRKASEGDEKVTLNNATPKKAKVEEPKKPEKDVAQAVDKNGQNDKKQPASGVRRKASEGDEKVTPNNSTLKKAKLEEPKKSDEEVAQAVDKNGQHDKKQSASGVRRKTSEGDVTPKKRTRTISLPSDIPASDGRRRSKSMDNDDVEEVIRERCVWLLQKNIKEDNDQAEKIAQQVEKAIYDDIGDANDHRYRSRVRSRIANLARNDEIGKQLMEGIIKARKFARMTADELATPALKKLREHLSEDAMEEHMLGDTEKVGIDNNERSDNAI